MCQLPISVLWVHPADVVLQLHVGFLLEALNLKSAVHSHKIYHTIQTHHQSSQSLNLFSLWCFKFKPLTIITPHAPIVTDRVSMEYVSKGKTVCTWTRMSQLEHEELCYLGWRGRWLWGRRTHRHQGSHDSCCYKTPAFARCAPSLALLFLQRVSLTHTHEGSIVIQLSFRVKYQDYTRYKICLAQNILLIDYITIKPNSSVRDKTLFILIHCSDA